MPPAVGDVLVSNDFADDAAVVRIGADGRGLVLTADVIAPIVDDPEAFGAIAATNSISDVYAMGGRPLFALNLVFFPDDVLPLSILDAILRGSARACRDMGVVVVGGHTVRDVDVKFGLSVVGDVDPERILDNRSASPGQKLVLSKALGTGILGTAIKQGTASEREIAAATASMTTHNGGALDIARRFRVTSCTDVTGFGLLGHLRNIVRGSGVDAVVDTALLPVLPGVVEHARAGRIPGGSRSNLQFLAPMLDKTGTEDEIATLIAADAQTSGGLLLCVHADDAEPLTQALRTHDLPAAVVGELRERAAGIDESGAAFEAEAGTIELRY